MNVNQAQKKSRKNQEPEKKNNENVYFEMNIDLILNCRICKIQFYSNNKLHRHLRKNCLIKKKQCYVITMKSNFSIIHLIRKINKRNDLTFRFKQYVKIKFAINLTIELNELCASNDTFMSLTNKQFVIKKYSDIIIHKTFKSTQIRKINEQMHDNSKYVVMNLYILETIKKARILTHFTTKIHLMNNLKINILLKIDVLTSKKMILNFEQSKMTIFTCKEFVIDIITIRKIEKINKLMRASNKIIISINVIISISMHVKNFISTRIDYSFFSKIQFTLNSKNEFFAHVIESNLITVQMRNAFHKTFIISKNLKMSKFQNYIENDFCIMRSKNCYLIIVSQIVDIKKLTKLSIESTLKKTILSNEIIVYDDSKVSQQLNSMIKTYSNV